MRFAPLAGLTVLALSGLGAPAHAQAPVALFSTVQPPPAARAVPTERAVVFAMADRAALQSFRSAGGGRLLVPLADGSELTLDLARFDLLAPGAVVVAHGDTGETPIPVDLSLFRGGVAGDPASWAVVSMSGDQVMGVISTARGRFEIGPPRTAGGAHVIGAESALDPGPRTFECRAVDPERSPRRAEPLRATGPVARRPSGTRLVCRVAVDCDYEYYANRFGGNLTAATNYILTVFGTIALIYERDLDVSLRIPLLTIWTTPDDPWTESDPAVQLEYYAAYWQNYRPGFPRDLAHLVSGRSLGGGYGYYAGICNSQYGYAISPVDGIYSYPTNSTTWDVMVIAHELGHNFNSRHTHSCIWQELGYVPPGALIDSCYTAEGTCYSGPSWIVPAELGTIMSYCHVLWPGMSNIRLDFHPACISEMRSHAQTMCLLADSLQPPRRLIATQAGGGTILGWTASPAPGVVRYDLYRSPYRFDLDPALVGSATGTSWVDSFPGAYFYKARAVRASDQSDFSNEATPAPCGPAPRTSYAAGSVPVALVVADFFGSDGIADLVLADSAGSRVVSLRGLRCGSCPSDFDIPRYTALAAAPRALVAADFNADGCPDVAAAGGGMLSILLNQQTTTFATGATYPLPSSTQSDLAVGDFDEDGILDLALADGDSVRIFRGRGTAGTGDGTFELAVTSAADSGVAGIVLGDFDEDGILDLAVARAGGVGVLLGQGSGGRGDGTFGPLVAYAAGGAASDVVTGDFDQDGILDLAVTNTASASVSVLLGIGSQGRGTGAFGPPQSFACGTSPAALAVCDLDEDGIEDLVTANTADATVSLLRGHATGGKGDGTFAAPQAFACGPAPRSVAARDLDEDGRPDLMVANGTVPGTASQLLFRCAGTLPTTLELTAPLGSGSRVTGTECTISWRKGSGVLATNVDVSHDGGESWLPLASGLPDTSFVWTVSGPLTSQALLRVYDPTVPTRADQSDSSFTIYPAELLAVPGRAEPALALHGVRPNPARAGLAVSFTLASARAATLELFDLAGRRLRSVAVGPLGPGPHMLDLERGARLAPGVYLVRLTQGGRSEMARGVVLR